MTDGESRQETGEAYRGNVVAQELSLIWHRICTKPNQQSGVLVLPWRGKTPDIIPGVLSALAYEHLNFTRLVDYPNQLWALITEIVKKERQGLLDAVNERQATFVNQVKPYLSQTNN